jgi:hypothetical protein
MVNPYRGEVSLEVDGVVLPLRLSLGALAGLEGRLGAAGMLPLIERFETGGFKADDLIILLHAGLVCAGWRGSEGDLRAAAIAGGPMAAARCAGRLLRVTFTLPQEGSLLA